MAGCFDLAAIECLDLRHNKLSVIPPVIGGMPLLRALDVSWNGNAFVLLDGLQAMFAELPVFRLLGMRQLPDNVWSNEEVRRTAYSAGALLRVVGLGCPLHLTAMPCTSTVQPSACSTGLACTAFLLRLKALHRHRCRCCFGSSCSWHQQAAG